MRKIRMNTSKGRYLYLFVFIQICYGCSNSIDNLSSYIEKQCSFLKNDTCYIDFKEVLNIDYDVMYIFGETTTEQEIGKILGLPYKNDKYISDSKYRMILLKNKEIVYDDDFYQKRIEFCKNSELEDTENSESTVFCIKYTSSIFKVVKADEYTTDGDKSSYFLTEVRSNVSKMALPK